jgi:hypothetical protein
MRALRKLPGRFRVGDWVSLDYGLRKITAQVVEDRGLLGVHGRRLYRVRPMPSRGDSFDFELAEEELEAAPEPDEARSNSPGAGAAPIPRSFDVIYIRQGDTRKWVATTRPTTGHDAVKAEGAVGTTTANWEGESKEEQFAIVHVLVAARPGTDARSVIEDVRRSADEVFKKKYPKAVIQHEEYTPPV